MHSAVGGEAIAQAVVVVTDPVGEVLASGHTVADGSCSFEAPQPDNVTVVASTPRHHPVAHTYCRLDLPAAFVLRGAVLIGGTDQPIPGARVSLIDAAGCTVAGTITGETGEYLLTDLDEGEYTLLVTGYPPVALGVNISAAEDNPFIVRLGHTGSPDSAGD
ncbi:carboxypeptidase regulatory-like domain-containing protein [Streptomyces sp. NPDC020192]|uniref:carboxypeptidase regulatory-like domain-containing protein n=1 Tax=Streptomyces sp. NPDC020192 TaxID=3365066 RepID=UPI00379CEFD9